MNRWLVCFTAVFVGCVASMPGDNGITADLACETARMVVLMRQEMPPAPNGDRCDNCDGTGKIGDGRIVMTCPVCKGTGKKPKAICTTGSCR